MASNLYQFFSFILGFQWDADFFRRVMGTSAQKGKVFSNNKVGNRSDLLSFTQSHHNSIRFIVL